MANDDDRFGKDLRLLPDLEREHDRFPGSDLHTKVHEETGLSDLETVTGADTLRQALLLRFLTPKGSLAHLGHPEYGSNLYKLVGKPNTETNRNIAKLHVLEALAREPRIQEVLKVTVSTPEAGGRSRQYAAVRMVIETVLRTVGEEQPVVVTLPVSLT